MTVVNPSVADDPRAGGSGGYVVTWAGLVNGDTGAPVRLPDFADRSVQVEGTFGSGGSCAVEGSNDGTTYHTLHDHFGGNAALTAGGVLGVSEVTVFVRPHVTAGDGTTSLNITMFLRRTRTL